MGGILGRESEQEIEGRFLLCRIMHQIRQASWDAIGAHVGCSCSKILRFTQIKGQFQRSIAKCKWLEIRSSLQLVQGQGGYIEICAGIGLLRDWSTRKACEPPRHWKSTKMMSMLWLYAKISRRHQPAYSITKSFLDALWYQHRTSWRCSATDLFAHAGHDLSLERAASAFICWRDNEAAMTQTSDLGRTKHAPPSTIPSISKRSGGHHFQQCSISQSFKLQTKFSISAERHEKPLFSWWIIRYLGSDNTSMVIVYEMIAMKIKARTSDTTYVLLSQPITGRCPFHMRVFRSIINSITPFSIADYRHLCYRMSDQKLSPCIELSSTGILHLHASTSTRPAQPPDPRPMIAAPPSQKLSESMHTSLHDPVILDVISEPPVPPSKRRIISLQLE